MSEIKGEKEKSLVRKRERERRDSLIN